MNCCDASGRCTNGSNCATRLVKGSAPLRFAPGVIEHTPRRAFGSARQQRELRRVLFGWALRFGFAALLCGAAGIGGVIAAVVIRTLER